MITLMPDLPVMLHVRERRVVVVGGGATARRRIASLAECGARVVVIAPRVDDQIEGPSVQVHRREYRAGDLEGAFLVVIATDDREINAAVQREAAGGGVLINRTDESEQGDLAVMAHGRRGPVTVAVSTGGTSAQAAALIRDQLVAGLDESWVTLLGTIGEFRERLRGLSESATRQAALRRLTDEQARRVLETGGEAALREHCERIIEEAGQV